MLNAYVLPSLSDLKLYDGTLATGGATRYGAAIARADDRTAQTLMAKHLVDVDAERVGFVEWLTEQPSHSEGKHLALKRFADERLGISGDALAAALDRLGKWVGYLVFFHVIRENMGPRGLALTVSPRQISALRGIGTANRPTALSDEAKRDALLQAYSRTSMRLGTRLYLPISKVRDELGNQLASAAAATLSDAQLDEILRNAPVLLTNHVVSFSPFSGPARGGLKLSNLMYAGYISIRPQAKRNVTTRRQ